MIEMSKITTEITKEIHFILSLLFNFSCFKRHILVSFIPQNVEPEPLSTKAMLYI
jgi:hypothetical protein